MSKTSTGSRAPTEKESTKEVTGAREGVSVLCTELDTTSLGQWKGKGPSCRGHCPSLGHQGWLHTG